MKKYICLLIGVALLVGCGGMAPAPPDLSGYVWPPPPNPPKVRLLKVIATDADIIAATTSGVLFGSEATFAFKKPHGIAADMEGNILVSDTYMNKVYSINIEKRTIGDIFNPYGWTELGAVNADNVNGLVGVASGSQVVIFDQRTKKISFTIGQKGEFTRPGGIAFDPKRKIIYIADTKRHEINAFDYTGKHLSIIALQGHDPGQVFFPTSLATDTDGRLYVTDTMNWRIQVFNPDGSLYSAFGEHGTAPGMFAGPKGIAVSNDGYLFVVDAVFNNFQIFDKDGKKYMFVGGSGRGYGQFHEPSAIFIDDNDKIYVADQTNRRIQIFQYFSEKYFKEHPEEAK